VSVYNVTATDAVSERGGEV